MTHSQPQPPWWRRLFGAARRPTQSTSRLPREEPGRDAPHLPPTVPWSREWHLLQGDAAVWIQLLPSQESGREEPIYLARERTARYRPHFRVGRAADLLGVEFIDGPIDPVVPGEGAYASVRFLYPTVDYSALQVGTEFEIIEGPTVIGLGRVMERSDASQRTA